MYFRNYKHCDVVIGVKSSCILGLDDDDDAASNSNHTDKHMKLIIIIKSMTLITYASALERFFLKSSRRHAANYRRSVPMMMPEGPEVRSLVDRLEGRYGNSHWMIDSVNILSGRYLNKPPENWSVLEKALPLMISSVKCKGKFIWFNFNKNRDSSPSILNESASFTEDNHGSSSIEMTGWSTLGLTGGWSLKHHPHARLAFCLHHKLTGNNEILYFYDMRNFGYASHLQIFNYSLIIIFDQDI